MTTKEKEINAIKALIEMDGYFAEYFKSDFETMADNIRKDFPIEMGTSSQKSLEHQKELNNELIKKHASEIEDLCDRLLCIADVLKDNRTYDIAVEKLGRKNAIARKHALGLPIDNGDIDYLLNQ